MYRSATTHGEKPNRRNFRVWNSLGQRGHVTIAVPDAAFSAVHFLQLYCTSCAVRSAFLATATLFAVYIQSSTLVTKFKSNLETLRSELLEQTSTTKKETQTQPDPSFEVETNTLCAFQHAESINTAELHANGPGKASDIPLSSGAVLSTAENSAHMTSFDKTSDVAGESGNTTDMTESQADGPGKASVNPLSTGAVLSTAENSFSFDKTRGTGKEVRKRIPASDVTGGNVYRGRASRNSEYS